MKSWTAYLLYLAFAASMVSTAHAQIVFVEFLDLEFTGPEQGDLSLQSVATEHFIDGADFDSIRTRLTGDINVGPVEGVLSDGYSSSVGYDLTIGTIPVNLYDLTLSVDAKLVNGGGTQDAPLSKLKVSGTLAAVDNLPDVIREASITKQLQGTGFEFVQGTLAAQPYVLAAGEKYRISLNFSLAVDTTLLSDDPAAVISHEFGGVSSFEGYQLLIRAVPVPEPSARTLCLLAVVGIAMRGATGCV
jgi:hypothetical protein